MCRAQPLGTHLIEYVLQALLCERRTLNVLHGAEFSRKPLTRIGGNRSLLLSLQLLQDLGVISQINLRADDKARDSGAVVVHLGEPLLLNVLKRRGGSYTEADQENIRLRI